MTAKTMKKLLSPKCATSEHWPNVQTFALARKAVQALDHPIMWAEPVAPMKPGEGLLEYLLDVHRPAFRIVKRA